MGSLKACTHPPSMPHTHTYSPELDSFLVHPLALARHLTCGLAWNMDLIMGSESIMRCMSWGLLITLIITLRIMGFCIICSER